METKTCTRCLEEKPLSAFSKNARNKTDGRQPKCKSCYALYREENKERLRQQKAIYSAKNSESLMKKIAAWQKQNPEKRKAARDRWYAKNKDKMKQIRSEWASKNPEYLTENCRPKMGRQKKHLALLRTS